MITMTFGHFVHIGFALFSFQIYKGTGFAWLTEFKTQITYWSLHENSLSTLTESVAIAPSLNIFEPPRDKTNKVACALIEDSDQSLCCLHEGTLGP